jgi:arylamine N-acetyltransferase
MQYSRRNSFTSARRAFERGYGYCMQHAYALVYLLQELGFQARVVQAFQNRFADGEVTSHAWVRVTLDGETRAVDPLFWDAEAGRIAFTPLSPVTGISPIFKALTWWGAPAVNAYRYYRTGKDL